MYYLQIKVRPDQVSPDYLDRFSSHNVFWNPAHRPGYSGVATFSKPAPLSVDLGIGFQEFDQEGRLIRIKFPGFTLFNVYFPSGQRGQDRVAFKLDFYAHLLEILDRAHQSNEKLVICGDFNTAHQEIDLRHPKENHFGFLLRRLDRYLSIHGFVIYFVSCLSGWHMPGGPTDNTKNNVGWRLDYFLVSERSFVPGCGDSR
jgi:exodeoxyribonuclease-3